MRNKSESKPSKLMSEHFERFAMLISIPVWSKLNLKKQRGTPNASKSESSVITKSA